MSPASIEFRSGADEAELRRKARRVLFRRSIAAGIGAGLLYLLAVAGMAIVKRSMNIRLLQWDEVVQGPAYVLGVALMLYAGCLLLRYLLRDEQ